MFNILNSDANIAIKVDIGVHFVLKHIKMRVLEYVLLPENISVPLKWDELNINQIALERGDNQVL